VLAGPVSADSRRPRPAADPAVITTWNEVAATTIAGPAPNGAGKNNAEAYLWLSFVQAAVYNAVNGITGEYELYRWDKDGPRNASPQAAAAAAAHRVLMKYFGKSSRSIATNLNAALATSLAQIPDGKAKREGVRYGERAADRLIRLRANDGRFAPVVFNKPLGPGVWRPTPTAMALFFDPWLGKVDPMVVRSLRQFRPGPPPPIASDLYVEEFEEVRDYGAAPGTPGLLRTDQMTQTATFFANISIAQLQAALCDLVTRRGLDISDSARLFAAVETSLADSIGTVWNGKFFYGWWRPITAIREAETDGNPATAGVAGWTPLTPTPPYPDWPSGLNGVYGALSTVLSRLNDDGRVDLTIASGTAGATRHYDDAAVIQQDVVDARVWSGIHFRTADEVGRDMGVQVGNWALDHHFQPTNDDDDDDD